MINKKSNQIFFAANERQSLYDVYFPSSDAKLPAIIFCHGFKGFKDWGSFPKICEELAIAGFVVISFNFSHNGITIQKVTEFTDLGAFAENNYLKELDDIHAILDEIASNDQLNNLIDLDDLSIIGHSRGGSMAILAAAKEQRIRRLISWAAVADLEDRLPEEEILNDWRESGVRNILNGRTGQEMPMNYQFVECLRENEEQLSIQNQLKKFDNPMLIIHGEKDEAVGLEHAYALQVWNPRAELHTIENTGHTFGGKHPHDEEDLPESTKVLIKYSLEFLLRH